MDKPPEKAQCAGVMAQQLKACAVLTEDHHSVANI